MTLGSVTLQHVDIRAATHEGNATGLQTASSAPVSVIDNSRISATASTTGDAFGISAASGSQITVNNSDIVSDSTDGDATGILLQTTAQVSLTNNSSVTVNAAGTATLFNASGGTINADPTTTCTTNGVSGC